MPEAKKIILAYLKRNPGSHFMSEIADEVRIDYGLAFKAASELLRSSKIKKPKMQ